MLRRSLLTALATALADRAGAQTARLPAIFSYGQSQTGLGGTPSARADPRQTDTVARFPERLFMFGTARGIEGNALEGVARTDIGAPRPVQRFDPAAYPRFAPYQDAPGRSANAATPFLFALTDRLLARNLLPNGLFGFTVWEGGAPLNHFAPPGDPASADIFGDDFDADGRPDPRTNFENLVAALEHYAALAREIGLAPFVPLIRFEHGEGRVLPRSDQSQARETDRYAKLHLRITDAIVAAVRRVTGQVEPPLMLLGGWGGSDDTPDVNTVAQNAVLRLVAERPDRYVGPTSSPYMAPLLEGDRASSVHPSFLGRVIIGEMQAYVADLCLDAGLRPRPSGFRPLRCVSVLRAPVPEPAFDLTYERPPGADGLGFVVDDLLPSTPNQGFGYLGRDAAWISVAAAEILDSNRVRVVLSGTPAPAGRLTYGYEPRAPRERDQLWNYRGNLACAAPEDFFYRPILAAPPYAQTLPSSQRHVAVAQVLTLP